MILRRDIEVSFVHQSGERRGLFLGTLRLFYELPCSNSGKTTLRTRLLIFVSLLTVVSRVGLPDSARRLRASWGVRGGGGASPVGLGSLLKVTEVTIMYEQEVMGHLSRKLSWVRQRPGGSCWVSGWSHCTLDSLGKPGKGEESVRCQ